MEELLSDPKICIKCGKPGAKFNCECKAGRYCGKDCQSADWSEHKKQCTMVLTRNAMKAKQELKEKEDESGTGDSIAFAEAQFEAGSLHARNGSFRKAESCFIKVQRCLTEAFGASHPRVAESKFQLGVMYFKMQRFEETMSMHEEALRILRSSVNAEEYSENQAEMRRLTCKCLHQIGSLCFSGVSLSGIKEKGIAALEEAKSIIDKADPAEATMVFWAGVRAESLCAFAKVHMDNGRIEKALEMSEEAMRLSRKRRNLGQGANDSTATTEDEVGILNQIGHCYVQMGKLDEAEAHFRESLGICRSIRGDKHQDVALVLAHLGHVLYSKGSYEEAVTFVRKALKIERKTLGNNHDHVAGSLKMIGIFLRAQGKHAEAVPMLREAADIYACCNILQQSADIISLLSKSQAQTGDFAGAVRSMRELQTIYEQIGPPADEEAQGVTEELARIEPMMRLLSVIGRA